MDRCHKHMPLQSVVLAKVKGLRDKKNLKKNPKPKTPKQSEPCAVNRVE